MGRKFAAGQEKPEIIRTGNGPESPVETPKAPETKAERKEGDSEREAAYARILSKIPGAASAVPARSDVATDAKETEAAADHAGRIEKLVGLAETKGVVHAVKVARHLDDNYLLDELHDKLLAADLHDALVKKGLIKEV